MFGLIEFSHLFTTFALLGLIWTIQLVHYPAFHYIEKERFVEFSQMHTTKITLFVMPLMLIEMLSSILGLYFFKTSLWMVFFGLNILNWTITFFISVPCHNILAMGKNEKVINKLVKTNWLRTLIWSVKVIILWKTI